MMFQVIDRLAHDLLERAIAFFAVNADALPRGGGLPAQDAGHLFSHDSDAREFLCGVVRVIRECGGPARWIGECQRRSIFR